MTNAAPEVKTTVDLLTTDEVAARLKVTKRTIYAWLKDGRLRGVKVGKFWRIRQADIDALLQGETTDK